MVGASFVLLLLLLLLCDEADPVSGIVLTELVANEPLLGATLGFEPTVPKLCGTGALVAFLFLVGASFLLLLPLPLLLLLGARAFNGTSRRSPQRSRCWIDTLPPVPTH
jgi:hypothetical protein